MYKSNMSDEEKEKREMKHKYLSGYYYFNHGKTNKKRGLDCLNLPTREFKTKKI